MKDTFRSISTQSEGFIREKGSKFLAFAHPVNSLTQIESILDNTKKEYYDSRHVCFAYRLGAEGEEWRAYDGGEPAHSAGDPIHNEIRSWELTNILVIVIRYFGGTKLGIPGLIDAYKRATKDALENTSVKKVTLTERLVIRFPYEMTSQVNQALHKHKLKPTASEYGADCLQTLEVRKGLYEKLQQVFEEMGILEK